MNEIFEGIGKDDKNASETDAQEETEEYTDPRMLGGGILFAIGILGICGSTFVGMLMMQSGMLADSQGFLILYYIISLVFILVTLMGINLVYSAIKYADMWYRMVSGVIFTVLGLTGASASTYVGYRMHGMGMMAYGYGFDVLYYLITTVFIGITFFGLYVVRLSIK